MWKSCVESLNADRIQKVSILSNGKLILYSEVIQLWQHSKDFRTFFISLLADAPFSAFFWETPALSDATINQVFEFVLVDSPNLAGVQANPSDFASHFAAAGEKESIITFPNLGKDALLVVPCPKASTSTYRHIAAFMREAPTQQKHALWQSVGLALEQKLDEHPIWLSTSGLGVYWLHIRLDSYPKYYSYHPYRVPK
ncbi:MULTISPECIES: DUF6940 family protein [unclassified Coleofasciculus]|uniref:DUF6940 family protein n=1 Tax=unclassified Coleofasciculus TaxID=2692782 RepID=UPI001880BA32|nr:MULTISPECIES: hypothetical protein [unclassified Coleofasciculus]MBE9125241.1 hypothetical protein [Coleofasciculus sp. LEGE 07081]MBE9148406.1 hypothetical protein [Coleofasciculus sp. LEGE 07092]